MIVSTSPTCTPPTGAARLGLLRRPGQWSLRTAPGFSAGPAAGCLGAWCRGACPTPHSFQPLCDAEITESSDLQIAGVLGRLC
ncbi:MAG: hypothetical protein IPO67_22050 [Deltaproteobacteria bacterium]|nr:hypothetical protein [Deltaproteobacteria bacterium]